MATVLFAWELGAGLGHVTKMKPLAEALAGRGHRVVMALRDLARAELVLAGTGVSYLQAPIKLNRATNRIDPLSTFAHILHNTCFGELEELKALVAAWRTLYEFVQPRIIVCDHSPTALLAARGLPIRRVVLGTGFLCPPDCHPLPDWRPWLKQDPARLRQQELLVLDNTNRLLAGLGQPPMQRLTDLYSQADETLLCSFPELDVYPARTGARYRGVWPDTFGKPPVWPDAPGPRVFGYVRPFKALPALFKELERRRLPTVLYAGGLDAKLVQQFRSPTLHFEDKPLDLTDAARQCDLAIVNATHGTTATMLLAGKPLLMFPTQLEQRLTAENVVKMGAGLIAKLDDPQHVATQLQTLLGSRRFTEAVGQFAQRYADFDWRQQREEAVERIEQLLGDAT
jgi:UDP:flavonoid glycosyltransferase YjiC (YdhE family)